MIKKYKNIIILISTIIIISFFSKYICNSVDIYDIKKYINSFKGLAPIIYIIMFSLVPLTFFPDSILAIASGVIFGFYKGYIYTTIGALIGASIAFFIARYLQNFIAIKDNNEGLIRIKKMIDKDGFYIIFLLRLIPLFPFDAISYGSGLTNIKYKDFLIATLIGSIPGIAVFTNIGASSLSINSTSFYISIVFLILLLALAMVLKKKFLNFKSNKTQ